MPTVFHDLQFFDRFTSVEVQGHSYRILPLQIIVWVSISPEGVGGIHDRSLRFPAIFDPAFTDEFLIHPLQLRRFAGMRPEHLRRLGDSLRTHDRLIPLHAAKLWLHRNEPGERDRFASVPAFPLDLERGIGLTTGDEIYPRLPLLGARALRRAELQVSIDYYRCRLSVRTRRKIWLFG